MRRGRALGVAVVVLASALAVSGLQLWRATRPRVIPATGLVAGVTRDGRLVTGEQDRLSVWSLPEGRALATIAVEVSGTTVTAAAALSPDGKLAAAVAFNGERVFVISLDEARIVRIHEVGETVQALAFSPDGKLLAAANHVGRIDLW